MADGPTSAKKRRHLWEQKNVIKSLSFREFKDSDIEEEVGYSSWNLRRFSPVFGQMQIDTDICRCKQKYRRNTFRMISCYDTGQGSFSSFWQGRKRIYHQQWPCGGEMIKICKGYLKHKTQQIPCEHLCVCGMGYWIYTVQFTVSAQPTGLPPTWSPSDNKNRQLEVKLSM